MKIVLAGWLALLSTAASAGPAVVVLRTAAIPALDEGGLMILAVVVGCVAGWAVRRRDRRK